MKNYIIVQVTEAESSNIATNMVAMRRAIHKAARDLGISNKQSDLVFRGDRPLTYWLTPSRYSEVDKLFESEMHAARKAAAERG